VKTLAATVVLLAIAAPAMAQPASFDGGCEFSGSVRFNPPMASSPQPIAQTADAPGTCSGTFVDRRGHSRSLTDAPVRDRAWSSGDAVSCAFGLATETGRLDFPFGVIRFAMTEYRVGATPVIRFGGRNGGDAWMPVTPAQSSDPVAAVQARNGGGLDHFDLDGHLRTMGAIRG
jgi:hypothetical protein